MDLCIQSALVTGGLVFVDMALVDHAVDDRDSVLVGFNRKFLVTLLDRNHYFLELATEK